MLSREACPMVELASRGDGDENPCAELSARLDAMLRDGTNGELLASTVMCFLLARARRQDVRVLLTVWCKTRSSLFRRLITACEREYVASVLPSALVGRLLG